ncbi:MAG TPA: hypothetical protein VFH11_07460 [Gemmatimonadota bacterium]|nr:hypothetical protein [Gemmatimonadota bacterium]
MSAGVRRVAWHLLVAGILPVAACGGGQEPGPPENRDTISLADPAPSATGDAEETDTRAIAAGRDTIDEAEADTAAAPDSATAASGSWTAGVVAIPSGDAGTSTLVSVRAARHEGFDRVVWELQGDIPGIHVEYVDDPVRSCGSGEPVPLPGDAWLEVRLTPANAHTEAGRPTIAERHRATDLPVVVEIVQTCDFEAVVTWVLAVRSPEPFRLARFGDPSRIVVDVRHRR